MWLVRGNQRLTRREFLALSAGGTAAAFLASCGGPTGGNNDEATFFINPGDTRAARYSFEGQAGTLFGPKDSQGGVLNINHARVEALDGNPQKQALLDFAEDGSPSKASLVSGESLSFEWVSASRVIITYRSADGSQEVRFPYDAANPPSLKARPAASYQSRKPLTAAEAAWLERSASNARLHRQQSIILPASLATPASSRCGAARKPSRGPPLPALSKPPICRVKSPRSALPRPRPVVLAILCPSPKPRSQGSRTTTNSKPSGHSISFALAIWLSC